MDMATLVGGFAAFCTTVSYFPQLKKCWETGEAGDLSLGMLFILIVGLAAWVVYGIMRSDTVVVVANSVSVCLLAGILVFKIREMTGGIRRAVTKGQESPFETGEPQQ
jgi:MtN3 and saliva related transmembrane protein